LLLRHFEPLTAPDAFDALVVEVPAFLPEQTIDAPIAEMYVQGVSTRRVKKIVEELCGMDVSSTQVSRASAELDVMLEAWRTRDLGCYRYLILDAQYEKVRQTGQVLDAAVLIACGVDDNGNRDILGCSVSLSEAEVHWRTFLSELKDRGMHGLELVVSDSHEGLKAARKAVFPSVPWQRCQFHLQQNAGHYVPKRRSRRVLPCSLCRTATVASSGRRISSNGSTRKSDGVLASPSCSRTRPPACDSCRRY
jgi:transposase-like protein